MSTPTHMVPTFRTHIIISMFALMSFIVLPLAATMGKCRNPLLSESDLNVCLGTTWVSLVVIVVLGVLYASLAFGRIMPVEACVVLNLVGIVSAWIGATHIGKWLRVQSAVYTNTVPKLRHTSYSPYMSSYSKSWP
jgi:hypothetical protein